MDPSTLRELRREIAAFIKHLRARFPELADTAVLKRQAVRELWRFMLPAGDHPELVVGEANYRNLHDSSKNRRIFDRSLTVFSRLTDLEKAG